MCVPTRVDEELYEAAKASGAINSRSAAQQIAHWASIGRQLEQSPAASQRDIEEVLSHRMSYDELGPREQSVVRARWMEGVQRRIAQTDLEQEFRASGESWSEADKEGNLVIRDADPAR